ncbi:MAG: MMPL family transporter [Spirochaetaceae bacterium]|jgi:predicted RND superfamily exporter protein|nr:MMPL family transporter [Spirochaetaceae bacterium]
MTKFLKYPALTLGVIAVITVFFAFQIPRAELDNNNIRFLPEKHDARMISKYIDDTFGGNSIILIGLERPYGNVFEPEFLARLKEFAETAENVEFVKDVTSLMSTQYITSEGDSIVVDDMVPEYFSGTAEEIAELRRRLASWDMLRGSIVSDDLSATQVVINLNVTTEEAVGPEVTASLIKIRNLAREMFNGMAEVYVTGQTLINATINEAMVKDNMLLIPLVVVAALAVLFFSFRSFTFVFLPLLTVIISVIWTIGATALAGIKLSIITTLLPVILVAVGSAYGIHLVTHYIEDTRNGVLTAEQHREAVFSLVGKLIKPVALAALTTLAGFISFCFTSVVPIREFGYFASFGVAACFITSVTLIPTMLIIRGPRKQKKSAKKDSSEDFASRIISGVFLAIAGKKVTILVVAAIFTVVSLYGLSKIIVDNVLIEFFQNETEISRSDEFIRKYFGGSKDLTLVVEADSSEELLDPAVLGAIDGLSAYLAERVPLTGKVAGFTDIVKRINQVFNADERPEGLAKRNTAAPAGGYEDGFGFGALEEKDFGFGALEEDDFGFGAFEEARADSASGAYSLDEYGVADLFALLDAAAGKSASQSGSDLTRELKKLVNYDGAAYYEIPVDPSRYGMKTSDELRLLVSNYLVLLSGDLDSGYANDPIEPTAVKTMVQLRATGNREVLEVIDTINGYIAANFPKNVRVIIGGSAIQEAAVTGLIVNAQIVSVVISVIMALIIVGLSYRSLAAGLIAAIPLALAIIGNFAVMGYLGIKLNIGTALIASVAVGIGIDYTIHFIDFFKHEYQNGGGGDFLGRVFTGCGKAILINALSVGTGFAVLAFSRFRILAEFGGLIALSMFITALVSLTVIPALLTTVKPKFIYRRI